MRMSAPNIVRPNSMATGRVSDGIVNLSGASRNDRPATSPNQVNASAASGQDGAFLRAVDLVLGTSGEDLLGSPVGDLFERVAGDELVERLFVVPLAHDQ